MTTDPTGLVAWLTATFGAGTTSVLVGVALAIVAASHAIMPWLPKPAASAGAYYRFYTVLRLLSGNYGQAAPAAATPSK
ncbi:MAG TPA: hypothetical protein PK231_05710 [Acidocella sp.]|nr:hypothetical protein [Acidocella sp.]